MLFTAGGNRGVGGPFLRRVPVQAAFNGTVATQRIIINLARIPLPVLRDRYDLTEQKFSLCRVDSAVLTRNINRWKLWRSIQVSDGKTQWKVIMLRSEPFSRNGCNVSLWLKEGSVCSIVPSRLIYRQPMLRGIREFVFPREEVNKFHFVAAYVNFETFRESIFI